jgi:hypothetical protein
MLTAAKPFDLKPPTPILITGTMRSGTTLMEQILSSHPDVVGCGELGFWGFQAGPIYYQDQVVPKDEDMRVIAEDYVEFLRAAAHGDCRFAIDKQPHNYEHIGLIHMAFPNAPIIYMKRNAVDTCVSIYLTPNSMPAPFACDKGNIAFVYEQHMKLMDHWRAVLPPGRIFEVKYEELVADREPILRRLLEYCGLEWSDACLDHEKNDRVVNTPSYWQVRQPVYKTSIDRWKRYEPWLGEFARLIEPPSAE